MRVIGWLNSHAARARVQYTQRHSISPADIRSVAGRAQAEGGGESERQIEG